MTQTRDSKNRWPESNKNIFEVFWPKSNTTRLAHVEQAQLEELPVDNAVRVSDEGTDRKATESSDKDRLTSLQRATFITVCAERVLRDSDHVRTFNVPALYVPRRADGFWRRRVAQFRFLNSTHCLMPFVVWTVGHDFTVCPRPSSPFR